MERIGFDLHGTLDKEEELFQPLLELLMGLGIKIYIISGPTWALILEQLNQHGYDLDVHFNEIISVADWLVRRGVEMWEDEKGRPWASDRDWWSSKYDICKTCNIELLVDDSARYADYFPLCNTWRKKGPCFTYYQGDMKSVLKAITKRL